MARIHRTPEAQGSFLFQPGFTEPEENKKAPEKIKASQVELGPSPFSGEEIDGDSDRDSAYGELGRRN